MRGYRNCTRCTRWRPITDFGPRKWVDGQIKKLSARCRPCRNEEQNKKYAADYAFQRRRKKAAREHQATKRREQSIPVRPVGKHNKGRYGAGRIPDNQDILNKRKRAHRAAMTPDQYRAYRDRENMRKRKK